jgi:predicted ATPase/DNA-binding XRE family transcriptional regulator
MTAPGAPAFGELLKKHRVAAGVTQDYLAEIARVSANAISSLERGVRRAPHRDTVSLLASALGLTGRDREDFEQSAKIVRARGATVRTYTPPNNFPTHLTSFVGREHEIARIAGSVAHHRLVTIVGSGGIGKTRTAVEAAKTLRDRYPDGSWFVDLAPLTGEEFVVSKIASVLDLRSGDRDALVTALKTRRLLLLLDNCEHVLGTASAVSAALLRACPGIGILATSRQRLGIAGEMTYRLASLSLGTAAELFAQRAAAADDRFVSNDETAGPIADICRRLDGIALAIELAAARVPALGLNELRLRIAQHFDVLCAPDREAPRRHQTVLAAFEWSYRMLDEHERVLFRRLGIFAGGCTLEAAEHVCGDDDREAFSVCGVLASLVEKSLVLADVAGDAARYRLLESTRSFALEKLLASGEHEQLMQRHAQWVANFAERVDATYQIEPRRRWMAHVEPELDNARAALEWALGPNGDAVVAGRIAGGLTGLWRIAGLESERRRWVLAALERLDEERYPVVVARLLRSLTGALNGRARVTVAQRALDLCIRIGDKVGTAGSSAGLAIGFLQAGEPERALPAIDRAATIYRQERRQASLPFAAILIDRSSILRALQRREEALADLRQAQGIATLLGDETILASIESGLAEAEFEAGNTDRALALAEAALLTARRSNLTYREMGVLCQIATMMLVAGDLEAARHFAQEALSATRGREPHLAMVAIQNLAAVSALRKNADRAARLLGYIDHGYQRETYAVTDPTARRSYEILAVSVREQLSDESLATFMEQGASISDDVAANEAMQA